MTACPPPPPPPPPFSCACAMRHVPPGPSPSPYRLPSESETPIHLVCNQRVSQHVCVTLSQGCGLCSAGAGQGAWLPPLPLRQSFSARRAPGRTPWAGRDIGSQRIRATCSVKAPGGNPQCTSSPPAAPSCRVPPCRFAAVLLLLPLRHMPYPHAPQVLLCRLLLLLLLLLRCRRRRGRRACPPAPRPY